MITQKGHMIKTIEPFNPWGLTENEVSVIVAITKHSGTKLAARELEIHPRTVESRMITARKKMKASNRVMAAILWDRYIRDATA